MKAAIEIRHYRTGSKVEIEFPNEVLIQLSAPARADEETLSMFFGAAVGIVAFMVGEKEANALMKELRAADAERSNP